MSSFSHCKFLGASIDGESRGRSSGTVPHADRVGTHRTQLPRTQWKSRWELILDSLANYYVLSLDASEKRRCVYRWNRSLDLGSHRACTLCVALLASLSIAQAASHQHKIVGSVLAFTLLGMNISHLYHRLV